MDFTHDVLPLIVPLAMLAFIARRNMRGRKLRMEILWVYPAIMTVAAIAVVSLGPVPDMATLAVYIAALGAGCALGWYRGKFTEILVDPETHEVTSKGTVAGMILLGSVFLVRYALHMLLRSSSGSIAGFGYGAARIAADALILFAVGSMAVQRIEVAARAYRLLGEARANKTNADLPSS